MSKIWVSAKKNRPYLGCRPGTSGRALTVALSISSSSSTMGSSKYHFLLDQTRTRQKSFHFRKWVPRCSNKLIRFSSFFLYSTNTNLHPKRVCVPKNCTFSRWLQPTKQRQKIYFKSQRKICTNRLLYELHHQKKN